MEVGQEVQVLPLELAEVACAAAGTKWNPPRQKRAGQRGTIAELSDEGAKAKVTFLDEIQDPETGAVVRTDTQTLLFPTTALQSVDAAGEAAQAQMEGALAAASAKVAEATADVSRLQAEKDAATVALQAQVDSLSKGKEQQTLKVTRLQKELASGLKAAEAATTAAAAAQEERRVALDRAQTAEGAVAGLERRVQLVVEAARGGQTAQHHGPPSHRPNLLPLPPAAPPVHAAASAGATADSTRYIAGPPCSGILRRGVRQRARHLRDRSRRDRRAHLRQRRCLGVLPV